MNHSAADLSESIRRRPAGQPETPRRRHLDTDLGERRAQVQSGDLEITRTLTRYVRVEPGGPGSNTCRATSRRTWRRSSATVAAPATKLVAATAATWIAGNGPALTRSIVVTSARTGTASMVSASTGSSSDDGGGPLIASC